MSAKRFIVRGRVQGVFFRATAADEAQRLGVTGRIWNRRLRSLYRSVRKDGAVEAEAVGPADALARFEAWLRHGPPHAEVESVDADALPDEPRYRGFEVS